MASRREDSARFTQARSALERHHLPGGSRRNKDDIVEKIRAMYERKKQPAKEQKGLVPTKAALYGLDVRFRPVDQAILDEKIRRNAFRRRKTRDQSAPSRHSVPVQAKYLNAKAHRDPTVAELQTTYAVANRFQDEKGLSVVQFQKRSESMQRLAPDEGSDIRATVGPGPEQDSSLSACKRLARHPTLARDSSVSVVESQITNRERVRPMSQISSYRTDAHQASNTAMTTYGL